MAVTPRTCRDFLLTTTAPNAQTFDGIIDASVTLNMETVEITEISDVDRKYIAGIKSGSASLTLYYDRADAATKQLETWFLAGTLITCVWKWVEDASNDQTYTGTFFITSIGNAVAMQDVVRQTVQLQLSGPVTMLPA
jgi:hypothetical protein